MRSLLSVIMLLAPLAAHAAPAPLQRRPAHAEVVFDAGTDERGRLAWAYLRSYHFRDYASDMDEVAARLPGSTRGERREWIERRLQVTVVGSRVSLWLAGHADCLSVLRVVAARLSGTSVEGDDHTLLEWQALLQARRDAVATQLQELRRLRELQPDRIPVEYLEGTEALLGHHEFAYKPLKVAAPPRAGGPRR